MTDNTIDQRESRENDFALDCFLPSLENLVSHLQRFDDLKIRLAAAVRSLTGHSSSGDLELANRSRNCLQKAHLDAQLRQRSLPVTRHSVCMNQLSAPFCISL